MNNPQLDDLKDAIGKLSTNEQDHLAGFLLMLRLKRNQLVMPHIHQRVEDADPKNWETLEKTRDTLAE